MTPPKKRSSQGRHRVTPSWRTEIDRQRFADALLLLAMHLDEKTPTPHKHQRDPASELTGQEGDDHDEDRR